MTRRQEDPLRPLTAEERGALERLSRASSEPASHVARAQLVLAVAGGRSFTAAARGVGRRSGDAVARLVARGALGAGPNEGRRALARLGGGGARRPGAERTSPREDSLKFAPHRASRPPRAGVSGWYARIDS